MKKLLLLLVLSVSLFSCTSEPLPANMITDHQGKYLIHWESNQIKPYMDITIIHSDGSEKKVLNISDHDINATLEQTDSITLSIGYYDVNTQVDPEVYLAVYKYKNMNLSYGVYT